MRALTIALCLIATPALADVAGVASVIDGDTMEVHGQRIRLHGIDAPESRQLCRLDGKPWQCGKDAANILADKIARRPVTCEDLGRDRYGDTLKFFKLSHGELHHIVCYCHHGPTMTPKAVACRVRAAAGQTERKSFVQRIIPVWMGF